MKIYVYVLRSFKDGKKYIGITKDLSHRLKLHNAGKVQSTKGRMPLELIYNETCVNYKDARHQEKFLKSGQGRDFLDRLQK